ncbi:DUF7312 domain-containing protein [Halococcoides cellulosivorans]|uniref:DUF7312 domain-containing protein n=1 Tax=Halococcoides cellulosivorans TaxID=1679096 RepID=A0A2R4X063_9EURY|nr:hypothetical protein [Halococcoides cellulosivorans]AWB27174.1 hypothetical protein HARCEL1_05375 [Halococcoides cellulosivorans]
MVEVAEESDGEWKFAVSDVGEGTGDEDAERAGAEEGADESGMEGVFGLQSTDEETLRRESIDLENALFVIAGVALTLFALWQAIP